MKVLGGVYPDYSGEITLEGSADSPLVARRRARRWDRRHLPGLRARPGLLRRRQHRPRTRTARWLPGLHQPPGASCTLRARRPPPWGSTCPSASQWPPWRGRAAAHRDRQGALAKCANPRHGRADGPPVTGRAGPALRDDAAPEAGRCRHRVYQPLSRGGLPRGRPGHRPARRQCRCHATRRGAGPPEPRELDGRLDAGRPPARDTTAGFGPEQLPWSRDFSPARRPSASLAIQPGEILGLAGLVGSGRTRLAHAIVGDLPSTGDAASSGAGPPRSARR